MSRLLFIATIGLFAACHNHLDRFDQTNLVSDQPNAASATDPLLINAWGIAVSGGDQVFVAANGTGVITSYTNNQTAPGFPAVTTSASPITGLVLNTTSGFVVAGDLGTAPAELITVSEDGLVFAFAAGATSQPVAVLDLSATNGSFKGATLVVNAGVPTLLVADFINERVLQIDTNFSVVPQIVSSAFVDSSVPPTFGPFGIEQLGLLVYVTFAEHGDGIDEVDGPGLGVVDAFSFDGTLVQRISNGPELNAPWGMALAPNNFDGFSDALLVGNFGDGGIHAYDPQNGDFLGAIDDANGNALFIDGLWGITFGTLGDDNTLFFAAGPGGEAHGLFGALTQHD